MGKTARLAIVVVPALIILLFLGTWQLQRLGWKQELIATMEDRLVEQPVALPSGTLDLNEWAFRPVEISGRFIDATPFIFPARTLDGAVGNDIVAPFLRDDDGTVLLVHRGWVANGASFDPAPEEAVVTGVVRAPWTNTLFRPENDVSGNQWFWMDLDTMAQSLSVPAVAPYYLSRTATGSEEGFPRARPAQPEISNNHLNYALTWYALAAILVIITILFVRRERS